MPTHYSWRFEVALRVQIILYQETKKLSGCISYKSIFYIAQITGRNIAKFSRSGNYKTEIQADILQIFQEVDVLNQNYRKKY